jgi:predicted secreted protein
MPILSLIAIYFIVWWLTLFMVLPWGARSQVDDGEVVRGSEPGAPAIARMWPKLLITSVIAAILMALLLWGLSNPFLREYWR